MEEEDPSRNAEYRILIPEDPNDDELVVELSYRDIAARVMWKDGKRQDLIDLIAQAEWFVQRAHVEYEVHRQATEIDSDLDALFPKKNEEESE